MPSIINTNISSLNAQLNLSKSQSSLQTSLQRLSSGLRINSAKDDAAGLSIADRMTSQINGLDQAVRNANDAISLSQTAEGALNTVDNNLQRIRQLAIQSANSTNSSSDRAALDAEAQSLITEIQRVSTTTQFNGLNLLDGSFTNSQFQVGANANQTISVSMGNASTSALGSYGGSQGSAVTATAWTAGSTISINGTVIGSSIDQSATVKGWAADSAAAKAAAINAQTSTTQVSASASTTLAGTAAPIGSQALNNGDLTINGVSIGPVTAAYGAAAEGANAAAAINLQSSTTGVTATADASSGKLTLTAADGRDIVLGSNNGSAGATRVLNATGLTAGAGTAVANSVQTFSVTTSGTNGDTLTIAGVTFTFNNTTTSNTVNSATSVTVGSSGIATSASAAAQLVAALNSAQMNSLTDSALGTITAAVTGTVGVSLTDTRYGTVATLSSTAAPGVGTTIGTVTTSTDGTNLTSAGGTAAQTTYGKLTLTSSASFTLADSGTSGGLAAAGLSNYSAGRTLLNSLSITTVSGSNTAITTIDAALAQVNSMRATLGATQNRFTSTVSNLQTTALNISAARSQIQDTNYAAETANLTRAQILQQAGTAMLAQANQLPNLVLSLLK